jgi:hypothetical protein
MKGMKRVSMGLYFEESSLDGHWLTLWTFVFAELSQVGLGRIELHDFFLLGVL